MMAANENKVFYNEKTSPVPSAFEPATVGHVGRLRRQLPRFSLEVRQEESSFAVTKSASNADFDPIPPSKRTWNWGAYVAYWMVCIFKAMTRGRRHARALSHTELLLLAP